MDNTWTNCDFNLFLTDPYIFECKTLNYEFIPGHRDKVISLWLCKDNVTVKIEALFYKEAFIIYEMRVSNQRHGYGTQALLWLKEKIPFKLQVTLMTNGALKFWEKMVERKIIDAMLYEDDFDNYT